MKPKATPEILDRMPPAAVEAERALLCSAIVMPAIIPDVADSIAAADFYNRANAAIFRHLVGMAADGTTIGLDTLRLSLREAGELEAVGGPAYLAELFEATFTPSAYKTHLVAIAKAAKLRTIIGAATETLVAAYDNDDPVEVASNAAERLLAVTAAGSRKQPTAGDLFAQTLQSIVEPKDDQRFGLGTGLYGYDRDLGGFYRGELSVLAARPSMGKSAFASQIFMHFADRARHALLVTLEMSARELAMRILSSRAGVDLQRIRTGSLTDTDRRALIDGNADLPVEFMHLVDQSRITTAGIRWEIMRIRQKHQLDLLVVDYLTRLQPADPRAQRYLQIGAMTGDLKRFALEFNLPVLCLAQLGRSAEGKGETRPRLSQLRESGDIEQDADVVMFLHRPERVDRDDPDARGKAFLFVEKNRNGPCAEFEMHFDGRIGRFTDKAAHTPYPEFEQWSA